MRILQLIAFMLFLCSISEQIFAQQNDAKSVSSLKDQGMLYYRKKM